MTEPLHDKTIEYLLNLKNHPSISESDYNQILSMLCEKVLCQDSEKVDARIQNIEESKQKCSSCGKSLESWERETCGPCRIKDPGFAEELDE